MKTTRVFGLGAFVLMSVFLCAADRRADKWTAEEIGKLSELSISKLEAPAPDITNRYAEDAAAVALGHQLFFDTSLSSNGKVSCATCHQAEREFQDGVALAQG